MAAVVHYTTTLIMGFGLFTEHRPGNSEGEGEIQGGREM